MEKKQLVREIGRAVMLFQDATQAFDERVGRRFELNLAERHCIALLVAKGPQMASAIAREISLTPPAVTALLDRLERRGFVRRRADPTDRRKVLVEADEMTMVVAREAYMPVGEAGDRFLERFTQKELETILRFVQGALEIQKSFMQGPDSAA